MSEPNYLTHASLGSWQIRRDGRVMVKLVHSRDWKETLEKFRREIDSLIIPNNQNPKTHLASEGTRTHPSSEQNTQPHPDGSPRNLVGIVER